MEGFIRGGNNGGTEVDLLTILPEAMRSFAPRAKQEVFADTWESRHGVLVRRPWETPTELSARRQQFAAGRAPKVEGETFGMSRELAEKTLKTYLQEYSPTHPDPKRANVLQVEIHKLQDLLGIQKTDFGAPIEVDVESQKRLQQQYAKYEKQDAKLRRKVVASIKNLPLLVMIRDAETDREAQNTAIERIAELELGG